MLFNTYNIYVKTGTLTMGICFVDLYNFLSNTCFRIGAIKSEKCPWMVILGGAAWMSLSSDRLHQAPSRKLSITGKL